MTRLLTHGYDGVRRWFKGVRRDKAKMQKVGFPWCDNGHWRAVYVDVNRHVVEFMDSMCTIDTPLNELERRVCVSVIDLFRSEWARCGVEGFLDGQPPLRASKWTVQRATIAHVPRQQDAYNCGMYAYRYLEHRLQGAMVDYKSVNMPLHRKVFLLELLAGRPLRTFYPSLSQPEAFLRYQLALDELRGRITSSWLYSFGGVHVAPTFELREEQAPRPEGGPEADSKRTSGDGPGTVLIPNPDGATCCARLPSGPCGSTKHASWFYRAEACMGRRVWAGSEHPCVQTSDSEWKRYDPNSETAELELMSWLCGVPKAEPFTEEGKGRGLRLKAGETMRRGEILGVALGTGLYPRAAHDARLRENRACHARRQAAVYNVQIHGWVLTCPSGEGVMLMNESTMRNVQMVEIADIVLPDSWGTLAATGAVMAFVALEDAPGQSVQKGYGDAYEEVVLSTDYGLDYEGTRKLVGYDRPTISAAAPPLLNKEEEGALPEQLLRMVGGTESPNFHAMIKWGGVLDHAGPAGATGDPNKCRECGHALAGPDAHHAASSRGQQQRAAVVLGKGVGGPARSDEKSVRQNDWVRGGHERMSSGPAFNVGAAKALEQPKGEAKTLRKSARRSSEVQQGPKEHDAEKQDRSVRESTKRGRHE